MARRFRDGLWTQLPTLWSLVAAPLAAPPPAAAAAADPTAAVSAMHVLRVLAPALAPELLPSLRPLLRDVCGWAAHGDARVRAAAARAAAALARCWTEGLMPELLKQVGAEGGGATRKEAFFRSIYGALDASRVASTRHHTGGACCVLVCLRAH